MPADAGGRAEGLAGPSLTEQVRRGVAAARSAASASGLASSGGGRNSAAALPFQGGLAVGHRHNPQKRNCRRVWSACNLFAFVCSAPIAVDVYSRAEYNMACFPDDKALMMPLIASSSAAASIDANSIARVMI